MLDGVYTGFGPGESPEFHPASPLRDEDVERLVRHVSALILGPLRRLGHIDHAARLDPDAGQELDELGQQHAAAIQGLIPLGPHAGRRTAMLELHQPRAHSAANKKLCADHRSFSLQAAARGGASKRDRLEEALRARHAAASDQDRLSLTEDGNVVYRFRHPWRNGRPPSFSNP